MASLMYESSAPMNTYYLYFTNSIDGDFNFLQK